MNKIIYDFLVDKVGEYVLRYPYQDAPIDFKKGFVTWQLLSASLVSTHEHKKQYVDNLNYKYQQRFLSNYYIFIEKLQDNADTLPPIELAYKLNIFLNSYEFINFCKAKKHEIASVKSLENIQSDTYFSEAKQWINRVVLPIDFLIQKEVILNDTEIHNVKITSLNHI